MTPEQNRIQSLDGLRASAIISVMLCHSAWKFSPLNMQIGSIDFQNIFYNGWSGVDLFFVLSGFLITSQLLKQSLTPARFQSFITKRFFRIAPAYYFSVTLFLILTHLIPATMRGETIELWFAPYLSHLFFMQDYIASEPLIDGVFWSIPVEIRFYLLCPFFIYGLSKIKNNPVRIAIITAFISTYLLTKYFFISNFYDTSNLAYIDYFQNIKSKFHFAAEALLCGFLCAHLYCQAQFKTFIQRKKIANVFFIFGLMSYLLLSFSGAYYMNAVTPFEIFLMPICYALAYSCLVIGGLGGCFAEKFLSSKILKFMADISYSLYLTHIFTFQFQYIVYQKLLPIFESPVLCWFILQFFYFGLSISLAYMMHIFIEKPCIDWSKKRWTDKKVTEGI